MPSHTSAPVSPTPFPRTPARLALIAAACDLIFVLVFTAIGRGSHAREATLAGLWQTAWPFIIALALSWVLSRAWRAPFALARTGIPVWLGTVALGLSIRVVATDSTAAVPFIVVTVLTLALFLLGWRLVALLLGRLRGSR